jgi:hypothetical protein
MTLQEKKSKMTAIIETWQQSGLTQIEFARDHAIKLSTFRYWIAKLRENKEDQPAFIHIGGSFTQGIHIRYPHGVELVLPFQTPGGLIRSLIHI